MIIQNKKVSFIKNKFRLLWKINYNASPDKKINYSPRKSENVCDYIIASDLINHKRI